MRRLVPACAALVACVLVRGASLAAALPLPLARGIEAALFALFLVALLAAVPWERPRPLALAFFLVLALAQHVIAFGASDGAQATTQYGPVTTWPAIAFAWGGVSVTLGVGRAALLAASAWLLARAARRAWTAAAPGVGASLAVSACPACVAPAFAALAMTGLDAAGPAATALDLAVPLLAAAALALPAKRPGAWLAAALLPPALAVGDLASGTSDVMDRIHRLYGVYNVVAILVTGAFLVALVVLVARGRKRPLAGPEPPLRTRRAWVWAWTAALLALFLAMMGLSLQAQREIETTSTEGAYVVHVTAMQWGWSFQYPNGTTSLNELRLPVGHEVVVDVTSRDVAHSFFVPDLGVQVNAIPGRSNEAHLMVERAGSWPGHCAEYCGIGHTDMAFVVTAAT